MATATTAGTFFPSPGWVNGGTRTGMRAVRLQQDVGEDRQGGSGADHVLDLLQALEEILLVDVEFHVSRRGVERTLKLSRPLRSPKYCGDRVPKYGHCLVWTCLRAPATCCESTGVLPLVVATGGEAIRAPPQ